MSKPKVITEFEKLEDDIKQRIKLNYPFGFEKHLIHFKNHKKHLISALPFEAEDRTYLVKMTREKAYTIITNDEDYNENGMLKAEKKKEYEDKFAALMDQVEETPKETKKKK